MRGLPATALISQASRAEGRLSQALARVGQARARHRRRADSASPWLDEAKRRPRTGPGAGATRPGPARPRPRTDHTRPGLNSDRQGPAHMRPLDAFAEQLSTNTIGRANVMPPLVLEGENHEVQAHLLGHRHRCGHRHDRRRGGCLPCLRCGGNGRAVRQRLVVCMWGAGGGDRSFAVFIRRGVAAACAGIPQLQVLLGQQESGHHLQPGREVLLRPGREGLACWTRFSCSADETHTGAPKPAEPRDLYVRPLVVAPDFRGAHGQIIDCENRGDGPPPTRKGGGGRSSSPAREGGAAEVDELERQVLTVGRGRATSPRIDSTLRLPSSGTTPEDGAPGLARPLALDQV